MGQVPEIKLMMMMVAQFKWVSGCGLMKRRSALAVSTASYGSEGLCVLRSTVIWIEP